MVFSPTCQELGWGRGNENYFRYCLACLVGGQLNFVQLNTGQQKILPIFTKPVIGQSKAILIKIMVCCLSTYNFRLVGR